MSENPADYLLTVRDMLRYAVSRFNEAELEFGHGVSGLVDDAVYLILETLHLPIDEVNPWLDARLTGTERQLVVNRIETRVQTRVPTPYLVNKAYIHGIPFYIDQRVIVPRSFIGEILFSDRVGPESGSTLIPSPLQVASVADICTGSGCLAILASMVFPNAEVDAVDLSPEALQVAAINVDQLGDGRVHLHEGDLFGPLTGRTYDLIITNPPYVDQEAMEALPPEYLAEPSMALDGGFDGLDIVRRILDSAAQHLNPGGGLLCEIGTGREILELDYPDLPFLWLDTAESEGEVFWLNADDLIARAQ
ncbi:50S ribosomal protein L3 N(5)-glutamine methyltransferase [Oryzibacter oryziterrae]|uniref:50S ribosomal protein L3 N(5)-glutamine methyltransferase n=1 Tax=Oryzibacter oryziterrae TaxID=2766474 RepID=UPI001EFF9152|nr:50S ribosomal protein L3 N(5)-glutamine methyltransferase [Oryzibacter oryziterrae]